MGRGIITGTDGNSLVTNIGVIFGDSGSPVLNRDKFVVGLVSAVASDGYQVYPHIGFLVRVSAIRKELAKL
jgi:S1-C subfamily serine protease